MRALKNSPNNLARPEQFGRVLQRALKNSAELFGVRQIVWRVFFMVRMPPLNNSAGNLVYHQTLVWYLVCPQNPCKNR